MTARFAQGNCRRRKQDVIEGRAGLCYKAASSRIAALPNGPLANPAHGVR